MYLAAILTETLDIFISSVVPGWSHSDSSNIMHIIEKYKPLKNSWMSPTFGLSGLLPDNYAMPSQQKIRNGGQQIKCVLDLPKCQCPAGSS